MKRLINWLASLSWRTGIIVACVCGLCYLISFAQFALPISLKAKGILWFIFFGLAKTAQYTAITILGKEGWQRLRRRFRRSA